ncbi:MAG: mucoidy inhibitor MuiA family protein [Bacteroidales bacterium]|nr:mucoidy inhibitor MuiA family protein [Bacteroidales bacterium]
MKRLILTSIFIASLALSSYADTEKEIRAGLKHVTVYPDRAQLTHEATVEIAAGKNVLKLTGLSPYIDAQSIQVKGYGDFTVLGVNLQNNYLQNLEELPEIKKIRNQIEELQIKVEDEKTAINVLKEKEQFLIANRQILTTKQSAVTLEQLKGVMDLYTANIEQVNTAVLKKNRLIKDYEKEITALQNQINDRKGKKQLPSGEISVSVSAEKALSGRLTFAYVVSNAGWYPSYDIRVDDITLPVGIFYKANVFQNTGVDWNNVKMSFSNASPWIAGDMPVLYPWFIDYFTPVVRYNALKGKAAGIRSNAPQAVMVEEAAADVAMMKEAEAVPVAVEKKIGETTVTFDIAVPYSVVSDGKVQTMEIQGTSTPASYKYVTTPKLAPMAYLTANITDWAAQNLQSGEATLYFENTYVGNSTLNVNQLSDTLTLSLGTDNSILVKREKRKDFTSRRVIGANKTEIYSFLITIRNNKSIPVELTLNDQIPVSSNSAITVAAEELSGGKLNSQTGQVKWDLSIKPQETKQIVLTYSVKYPKDKTVTLE